MLIDGFVPRYDVIEHHEILVQAPAQVAYEAVRRLDLARSRVVLALLAIRGVPHLLRGRIRPARHLDLDFLLRSGFVLLAEKPGVELVFGVVGEFWRPTSGIRPVDASEFAAFDEPGYAKAAWNLAVIPGTDTDSVVLTETRVVCTDARARRRFLRYWRVIGPFSALIRRRLLHFVRDDAQRLSP